MKIIINLICRILWIFISTIEKAYWYVWRNIQKQRFASCGSKVSIGRHCFFTNSTISIGDDVSIGRNCCFQSTLSKIIIGNHVMFGPRVTIHGGNHRTDIVGRYMKEVSLDEKRSEDDLDVVIEEDVWIGGNAIILKGVRIGEGSVIGAGSVITRNVPAYTIIVGSKPQKSWERFDEQTILHHKHSLIEKR